MKKTYQKPERTITVTSFNRQLLAGSKGVTNGSKLGNEYSSSDVSYSRQAGEWEDDEDL